MQQRREEDVFCYLGKSAIIFEYFSISNNIFFLRKTFSLQHVRLILMMMSKFFGFKFRKYIFSYEWFLGICFVF